MMCDGCETSDCCCMTCCAVPCLIVLCCVTFLAIALMCASRQDQARPHGTLAKMNAIFHIAVWTEDF